MVRVRKLVLAIAAASALNAGSAYALGLGELSLQSALNQPLVAEIELLQVRDLEQIEIRPSLASAEEFNKAGVDRQFFLTDLTFTPVVRPNGKSVIRVTSSKPVREPYLNFLMEVVWPNGRLLREYTLLVDPPLYTPTPVVATPSRLPAVATGSTPVRTVAPTPASRPAVSAPSAPAPASAPANNLTGSEYRTTSRDTLWEIAQRVSPGSVHQTMLAIQDLNPDAFIGGNINRLKTGQVLRLPTEEQIRQRSQRDAVAQVAVQNTAWREGRTPVVGERQLDATKRASAGAAPAQAQATDSLRLVAADAGSATSGADTGSEQVKALNDKLAVTQESLDSSRRENADLQGQVQSLESQLEKLERLLEIRNNQLAQLEADLRNASVAADQTPAPEVQAQQPVAVSEVNAPVVETEAAVAAPVVETPEVVTPEAAVEAPVETIEVTAPAAERAEIDFNYSEEPVEVQAPVQNAQPEPVAAEAAPVAESKPAPAPVAQSSLIDELLGNQMLMGVVGGAAILLLLALLMFLSRRNAKREAEMQEELMQQEETAAFDAELDFSGSSFEGFDEVAQSQTAASDSAPSADPLGEADIYIAYGKFTQAAELLQNAINDEPQRTDLRLKLMEVYAELDDREGFAREENELREIGVPSSQLDQLKAKYPNLLAVAGVAAAAASAAVADDFNFDDLGLSSPEAAAAPTLDAGLDDSFDLGLDSFDDVLASDAVAQEPAASAELDDFASLSMDAAIASEPAQDNPAFDLDLSFEATEKAALSEAESALDDFSFDLNESAEPTAADENLLGALDEDFALDLNADLASEPSVSTEQALADLEADLGGLDLPSDFDLSVAEEAPVAATVESDNFLSDLDQMAGELEDFSAELASEPVADAVQPSASVDALSGDDDFDFLSGTDETATKLDLARAYIDMGDSEGAKDILDEVLSEGNENQQTEARELLAGLS